MKPNCLKKYVLEFSFNVSPRLLFHMLSTPEGLNMWYADRVVVQKNIFHFYWKDTVYTAELSKLKDSEIVHFKWIEGETDQYFEFLIKKDSIDNIATLYITDFALEDELDEARMSWEFSINKLLQAIGCKLSHINL